MRKLCLLVVLISACTDRRTIGAGGDDPDQTVVNDSKPLDFTLPDSMTPDAAADTTVSDAGDCWSAWLSPEAVVTETQRPTNGATIVRFRYLIDAQGIGRIDLYKMVGHNVVFPDSGPLSPSTHSGKWVELRDSGDNTLHTLVQHQLVPEYVHPPAPQPGIDGGYPLAYQCPEDGYFSINNISNDPAGTQLVLYSEPIDGMPGGKTVELARFQLP